MKTVKQIELIPTLLLVDNHPLTAEIEITYFKSLGFQVFHCTSLLEAQKVLSKKYINLIYLEDTMLGKMNPSNIENLRTLSYNDSVKIILASVQQSKEHVKKLNAMTADLIILKPTPHSKLTNKIKKLLNQSTRKSDRIKLLMQVDIDLNGKTHQMFCSDVSHEGVHILDKEFSLKGKLEDLVELKILLPRVKKSIIAQGKVVRITESGYGISFVEIDDFSRRKLNIFIEKNNQANEIIKFYD